MDKRKKLPYIISLLIPLAGVVVLAILYTIEINKTITTPELINELLVEEELSNINADASTDAISQIQEFIQSEDFTASNNYLELEGENARFIIQFRYEENRELRILNIEEINSP
ncbi:hypothetical protein [Shouchella lehensis]|uniref:Uncharacterized protein n=2 Tax=Shouchella lehensis TaxID=300825 RepID=A0A060LT36_9BACI|nr:hypothetical protein [Shouchella lehensis]AIC93135.1 hypothetical protein BleG1_0527 [Shouchella lehensis G1]MBG9783073.1 hypothetical protein [Shouchella lehensis]TES49566.1 hypothetical protein E2L03_08865 [Shouchella lehensis]